MMMQNNKSKNIITIWFYCYILFFGGACPLAETSRDKEYPLQDAGFIDARARDASSTELSLHDLGYIDTQPHDAAHRDAQTMQDALSWGQGLASPQTLSLQRDGQCKQVYLIVPAQALQTQDAAFPREDAGPNEGGADSGFLPDFPKLLQPLAARAQQGRVRIFAEHDCFRICAQAADNVRDGEDIVELQAQDGRGENYRAEISVQIYAAPAPFAQVVSQVEYGEGAGFGQDAFPENVLGPPQGAGDMAGSMDVLSLGAGGEIILDLGQRLIDATGPDLLVFENPFAGFVEPAEVSVSLDAVNFYAFPCAQQAPYAGCAGIHSVWSNPDNDRDPTDPEQAGGDAFDLAQLGLSEARYVKVRDVAGQDLGGHAAGFDLDALAAVHRLPLQDDVHLQVPAEIDLEPGECAAIQADLIWGQGSDDAGAAQSSEQGQRLAVKTEQEIENPLLARLLFAGHFVCALQTEISHTDAALSATTDLNWTYGPLSATTRITIVVDADAGE